MKELYALRKETMERIFGTAKEKPWITLYANVWKSPDGNEYRAFPCVHEFNETSKNQAETGT